MASEWIAAVSGLVGTIIGGGISYLAQRSSRNNDLIERRRAVAGAFAAEIEAYLFLMSLRDHHPKALALAARIRAGSGEKMRGFLDIDAKPLDEFPLAKAQLSNIGILGDVCFDLVRFYSLVAGVQSTVISGEKGKYDAVPANSLADMIEHEAKIWDDALKLAVSLVQRLRIIAGLK